MTWHHRPVLREGEHHLLLCFAPDGAVHFYPETDAPEALARRFAELVRLLIENPSAFAHAAGFCAPDDRA